MNKTHTRRRRSKKRHHGGTKHKPNKPTTVNRVHKTVKYKNQLPKIPKEITLFISGHGELRFDKSKKMAPLNKFDKDIFYYNPMPISGCIIYDYKEYHFVLKHITNKTNYMKNWKEDKYKDLLQSYCQDFDYSDFMKQEIEDVMGYEGSNPNALNYKKEMMKLRETITANEGIKRKLKCKFRDIKTNKTFLFRENEFPFNGVYLFNSTIKYPTKIKDMLKSERRNVKIQSNDGQYIINKTITLDRLGIINGQTPCYDEDGNIKIENGEQLMYDYVFLQSLINLLAQYYDRIIIYDFTCNVDPLNKHLIFRADMSPMVESFDTDRSESGIRVKGMSSAAAAAESGPAQAIQDTSRFSMITSYISSLFKNPTEAAAADNITTDNMENNKDIDIKAKNDEEFNLFAEPKHYFTMGQI